MEKTNYEKKGKERKGKEKEEGIIHDKKGHIFDWKGLSKRIVKLQLLIPKIPLWTTPISSSPFSRFFLFSSATIF